MISVELTEQTVICNLKKYMDTANLTITELSQVTSINQNTVRAYAKNRFCRIDCSIATKLCKHFNVSFGEMFELLPDS